MSKDDIERTVDDQERAIFAKWGLVAASADGLSVEEQFEIKCDALLHALEDVMKLRGIEPPSCPG